MNKPLPSSPLRSAARNIVLHIMGRCSRPAPGVHILNGHRIQHEAEPESFRQLLSALSKHTRLVRIEQAIEMIATRQIPTDEPCVAFTFDDGFMECHDVFAPVLEEFGVNGLFFVCPDYVEGNQTFINQFNNEVVLTPGKQPMRWAHIEALSRRGHLIGAHTMGHYMCATDDYQQLCQQIVACKAAIEPHLGGKECLHFAFPYGRLCDITPLAVDIACKAYPFVFSQSNYKHYFSFSERVINRRHFEPFWPLNHVRYFISANKKP